MLTFKASYDIIQLLEINKNTDRWLEKAYTVPLNQYFGVGVFAFL